MTKGTRQGWRWSRLDQCCEVVSGSTPRREVPAYWGGDIPWVTPRDLSGLEGPVLQVPAERITKEGYESCSTRLLPPGAVLFSSRAPVGLVAIAGRPMCTNQGFKNLIPGPDLDSGYLYWCLRRFGPAIERRGSGTTFTEVSKEVVSRFEIPVPPLAEQRRIAAVLDKADSIRRKRRESLKLLDEFLRSAFLEIFGDPVRNERGWEVAPLESLIDPGRPITYGILKPGPDTPGGVPYVRVVDMANGTVRRTGVKRTTRAIAEAYRRSVVRAGDLLLSIRGHVGRIAVVPQDLEAANITQDTARLALLPRYSREYAAACLTSAPMQNLMRRYVRGVAVTGINLGDVKKLPVPTPPLEVQQRFTSVALRHSSLTARAREAQDKAQQLFDSLAQRAFA